MKTKNSNMLTKTLGTIRWTIWCIILLIIVLIICFFVYIASLYGFTRENMHEKSMITDIGIEQEDWWYTYKNRFIASPKWLYKQYTLKSIDKIEDTIKISSKDYPRINICYNYRNYLYLNLDFDNWIIKDWSVIDKKTKEDLWKLDYTDVEDRYDFEKKYETVKLASKDSYNLSELEENTVYEIFIEMDEDYLTSINNDLDYPVIVHQKGFSDDALGLFKPNIYLQNAKDNWWSKEKWYAVDRYFIFQKADPEDIQAYLKN